MQRLQLTSAEAKQRVIDWFNDPQRGTDDWKVYSYRELAVQIGVSYIQVRRYLPKLVMQKHDISREQFDNVRYANKAVRKRRGVRLLENTIQSMRQYRKTHTVDQIAEMFGVSPSTVSRHTKENTPDDDQNAEESSTGVL